VNDLARALGAARPRLDADGRRLARALYEELAKGEPVLPATIANRTGIDEISVRRTLDGWPGVFRDGDENVIAYWGLAIPEMSHRFEVDGRRLHTWCAFDPLFIAPLLGRTAIVTSTCPVTERAITFSVGPDGYRDLDPSTAVLSFLEPRDTWTDDVIETFCHYVLLFATPEAGETWIKKHPGTFLLPLDEAFELGQRSLGRLLDADGRP
jgi:alkylmercury lyase